MTRARELADQHKTLDVDGGTIKLDGNYPVGTGNVALGDAALDDGSLSGNYNTAVGNVAMTANTTGEQSVGIGHNSLGNNTTGNYNVAVGFTSLYTNNGSDNVAIGQEAAYENSSGNSNTAIGKAALRSNTTASNNTAVGYQAAYSTTTGIRNTALGNQSLYSNTTGQYNTAVGHQSLYFNTANNNTSVGWAAVGNNTTGENNTATGKSAMGSNTTGSSNVAVGTQALALNTTASNNTGLGFNAGYSNTTGAYNVFIGGYDVTGYSAAFSNTTGASNVAIGNGALSQNTTASNNTAVGYQAGYRNTTGSGANTFIGGLAGYNCDGGYFNTLVGYGAGIGLTTGVGNTIIGPQGALYNSGGAITTGSKNTIIGNYSGNNGGLDIRTASNNIVLSDGDGTVAMYRNGLNGNISLGNGATGGVRPVTAQSAEVAQTTSGNTLYYNVCDNSGNNGSSKSLYFRGLASNGAASANLSLISLSASTVSCAGALTKASGSFRIPHPLEAKEDTHDLVHSFVEAPQADNIYRGKVALVAGSATVNIDTVAGMTDGTFAALNREVQCFTSNETGWTAVRGAVSGNALTITAQDNTCTDTISWLVIGERKDAHMYGTDWTDDDGKVIVEPLKKASPEGALPEGE